MGIRESLLNTITSVGSSDFVRIVTSAGASSKATLQNVIKSFETGLGAKSSLTDSDYIRVVGSDNNLYKQSVSDVVETINGYNNTVTRVSDCNDATDPSKIYYADGNTANRPANAWWFIRCEAKSGNMLFQTAYFMNATDATAYQRSRDTNGTWGAWAKVPTREEVAAINNKIRRLDWGSSWTINVDVNKPFIAFTPDALFVGNRWGTSIAFQNIGGGAGRLTATVNSDNTVTITATSATFVTIVTI